MFDVHRVSLPLKKPLKTGAFSMTSREVALVSIEHDGCRGWGEVAALEGWGTESLGDAMEWLQSHSALDEVPETLPATRVAVQTARLDLKARLKGVPLWKTMAAEFDSSVSVLEIRLNATVGAVDLKQTLRQVERAVDAGFRTVKLKVGAANWRQDVDRVSAVRSTFGDLELRLDANRAWTLNEARHALKAMEHLEIAYVEEPAAGGYDAFRQLAPRVRVDLAADETVSNADEARRLISEDFVGALVLKPSVLGGHDVVANLVAAARDAGIASVITSSIDSAVGRSASAHLAAALGIKQACGLATGGWFERDVGPVVDGPVWHLNSDPGLGFEPDLW